ncbi:MAG: hypothetical protein GXO82_04905 [Chlorobi bacterium]|nr:hypothetical protein [Chlorobiota bacterium]
MIILLKNGIAQTVNALRRVAQPGLPKEGISVMIGEANVQVPGRNDLVIVSAHLYRAI